MNKDTPDNKDADLTAFPVMPRSLYKKSSAGQDRDREGKYPAEPWEDDNLISFFEEGPFRGLRGMFREMDALFDSLSDRFSSVSSYPKADVYETGDNVVVELEIPGLSKNDLDVNVYEGYVNVSGKQQRKNEYRDAGGNLYRKEEYHNAFLRTLPLPVKVKHQQAKAEYRGDILSITVPKA